nr:MAG TPA: hypothetical protein [Caudoviricetes sp.]
MLSIDLAIYPPTAIQSFFNLSLSVVFPFSLTISLRLGIEYV